MDEWLVATYEEACRNRARMFRLQPFKQLAAGPASIGFGSALQSVGEVGQRLGPATYRLCGRFRYRLHVAYFPGRSLVQEELLDLWNILCWRAGFVGDIVQRLLRRLL